MLDDPQRDDVYDSYDDADRTEEFAHNEYLRHAYDDDRHHGMHHNAFDRGYIEPHAYTLPDFNQDVSHNKNAFIFLAVIVCALIGGVVFLVQSGSINATDGRTDTHYRSNTALYYAPAARRTRSVRGTPARRSSRRSASRSGGFSSGKN